MEQRSIAVENAIMSSGVSLRLVVPDHSSGTDCPERLKIALLADAAHVNVQRWCEGLTQAGADVHVLSFRFAKSAEWTVYPLPVPPLPGKLHYVACIPYVRRLINRIEPNLLVCYYVTGYGTTGALTGFRPLVQVTSGSDVLLAVRNPLMKRLVRHNLQRAELVTAWAPHMARAVERLGVDRSQILTLPRGIPFNQFVRHRCRPPRPDDFIRIISTRSLQRDYNLVSLLRAIYLLHKDGVKVSLTLAGDGPQRQELVDEARGLGLEASVHFAGFVSNDELPLLLAEHNVYVSLSDSDGVSASLLEAMVAGLLPIVPLNSANELWIKGGRTGLLLEDLSPASVARAIKRVTSDAELRERAWRENWDVVQSHGDLYRNCERYVECFRRLAGGSLVGVKNDSLRCREVKSGASV